ncbi:MAG: hypothetical protein Alpg2KO_33140 [Alphaproteobacteria bacterium]
MTPDRIGAFFKRNIRWMFPTRTYLRDYTGPRPWNNVGFGSGITTLLAGMDKLLETYGPREDYALPRGLFISDSPAGRARREMGRSLKSYDQWRNKVSPLSRSMYDMRDLDRVLDHYADLLEQHGPDADYTLPRPPHGIGVYGRGHLARHDAPMQMELQKVGKTLADFDLYRAENVARREGLWVRDRGMASGIFPSWSRFATDPETGKSSYERRKTEPQHDLFNTEAYLTYQKELAVDKPDHLATP